MFLSVLEFAHVIEEGKITSTMYTIRVTYVMHTKKYCIVIFIGTIVYEIKRKKKGSYKTTVN